MIVLIVQLSLLIMPLGVASGEVTPWEREDIVPIYRSLESDPYHEDRLGVLAADALIGLYQRRIAPQSVSRCPFYISCSNYAKQAVRRYGLVIGICFFIDRHFYREHLFGYRHYGLREQADGILKLDDSFYIYGPDHE